MVKTWHFKIEFQSNDDLLSAVYSHILAFYWIENLIKLNALQMVLNSKNTSK